MDNFTSLALPPSRKEDRTPFCKPFAVPSNYSRDQIHVTYMPTLFGAATRRVLAATHLSEFRHQQLFIKDRSACLRCPVRAMSDDNGIPPNLNGAPESLLCRWDVAFCLRDLFSIMQERDWSPRDNHHV